MYDNVNVYTQNGLVITRGLNIKMPLTKIGIPMLKIRWSCGCLIFNMGIPMPETNFFIMRQGPESILSISLNSINMYTSMNIVACQGTGSGYCWFKLPAAQIGIFWKNSSIWWSLMPCAPRSSATMELTTWDKWVLVSMRKDFIYLCHFIV